MIEVKKMFTNTMLLPCALIQLYFSATKETLFFSFTTLNMGAVGTLLGHCWDTVGTYTWILALRIHSIQCDSWDGCWRLFIL